MTFLDSYRLPGNPFAPQQRPPQPRQQMPQASPMPRPVELPAYQAPAEPDTSISDLGRMVAKLGGPDPDDGTIMNALERAERAMRALPRLPADDYSARYTPSPSPRRAAMSPTEGPDTGEENPNAGGSAPGGYFKKLVGPESGGNPSIRNKTTGAGGLFQFLPSTWQSIMKQAPHLGLTAEGFYDPSPEGVAQQERGVRYYTDESMRRLVPMLGRQPTMGELYALHFLGHGGGMQLLQGLDRPTEEVVSPAAIAANPWLKEYTKKPAAALLRRLEAMMG